MWAAGTPLSGDASGGAQRRYRTAYAGLSVVANDDGLFTIVDTHPRLVRVDFG